MKYLVIIGDGMADFPIPELGGKTPLAAAGKPWMDMIAGKGYCGKVVTVPDGFPPGSDVAGMSIFGYNPAKYYTGRAPIEAAGMGIPMANADVAFRCNLVTLDDSGPEGTVMADYSGGHIATEEARRLIAAIGETLGSDTFRFYPGVGYRHIMIWKGGRWEMESTPPHDITGRPVSPYLPSGPGSEEVLALMDAARTVLSRHPVNEKRRVEGKGPANAMWLWGQGRKAGLPPFMERYGLKGATVAAVDLIKGLSALVGFDTPVVEGATGYLDTDYSAKATKALELLRDHDIVFIHVEAPDEASHAGRLKEKIEAIENIDRYVVGRVLAEVADKVRILLVTDHATPISMRTHFACPVPFVIYESNTEQSGCTSGYTEESGETVWTGEELMTHLVRG